MEKIPTAEEMEMSGDYDDYTSMMLAFARMHVTAALKAASLAADCTIESYESLQEGSTIEVDTETILNAYPLTNIE